jgi:hypothetical protein
MFATLLGPLPRPPLDVDAAPEAILEAVLAVQLEHGLEPLTDGGWPIADEDGHPGRTPAAEVVPVAWRATAARTDGLVKAVMVGPYSSGSDGAAERRALLDLISSGCRWIEVHEPAATRIGDDQVAQGRFADLHRALTRDLGEAHLTLAIAGGSAAAAGIGTILAGAYSSLAVDLIDGPDNWDLVVGTPGDRGIIAGVVAPRAGTDDGPEIMLWAAGYAASTGGRGMDRVGLASSGSYASLDWDVAVTKVRQLGEAARLAIASPDALLDAIDPRAIDNRSAATGRRRRRSPN